MTPEEFIRNNIITKLKGLGFQGGALEMAADEGISHYRRCSQASRRGAMFDDCFHAAKVWIEKYGNKTIDKPRRRTKAASPQASLF